MNPILFTVTIFTGVILCALKLSTIIDWSWWWVTLPFWGMVGGCMLYIIGTWVWYYMQMSFDKFFK